MVQQAVKPAWKEWAEQLGQSLRTWLIRNGYKGHFVRFGTELGLTTSQWGHLIKGENLFTDDTIYARIYVITGLSASDPRALPERVNVVGLHRGTKRGPWSQERYTEWLADYNKSPLGENESAHSSQNGLQEIADGADDIRTKRRAWMNTLAMDLRQWCDDNGYRIRKRFGENLGITVNTWENIIGGKNVTTDITIYARMFARTQLPAADPRRIPPRLHRPPKSGLVVVPQAWTEEQYQEWLAKQVITSAEEVQGAKISSGEVVAQEDGQAAQTELRNMSETFAAFGAILDRFLGNVDGSLAKQIATAIVNELRPIIREEVAEVLAPKEWTRELSSEPITPSGQIDNLLKPFIAALERELLRGTRKERDDFVRKHPRELQTFYRIFSALSLDDSEAREQALQRDIQIPLRGRR